MKECLNIWLNYASWLIDVNLEITWMKLYVTGWCVGSTKEEIQRKLVTIEDLTLRRTFETAHGMKTAERQASELQASSKFLV